MKYVELTMSTPEANLAGDEALLDQCEEGHGEEVLRFWEPPGLFIVLGYSGRVEEEVNLANWRCRPVPILRRCSGGGAVVQGPGCLNYSLVLRILDTEAFSSIVKTNACITQRHQAALTPVLGPTLTVQGSTDLALGTLKFSGNSQRRRRQFVLFHGTFLLNFDLEQIETLLSYPPRQPYYRQHRAHRDFVTNLKIAPDRIKEALKTCWKATCELDTVPLESIRQLAREKYSSPGWRIDPRHPPPLFPPSANAP